MKTEEFSKGDKVFFGSVSGFVVKVIDDGNVLFLGESHSEKLYPFSAIVQYDRSMADEVFLFVREILGYHYINSTFIDLFKQKRCCIAPSNRLYKTYHQPTTLAIKKLEADRNKWLRMAKRYVNDPAKSHAVEKLCNIVMNMQNLLEEDENNEDSITER